MCQFGKPANWRQEETSVLLLRLFLFILFSIFCTDTSSDFPPCYLPLSNPPGTHRLPHLSLSFPPLLPHPVRLHLVHFHLLLHILSFLPPTGGSSLPATLRGPPLSALDIPLHISRPPNTFIRLATSCGSNRGLFIVFLLFCSSRRHDFPIGSGETQRCWLGSQPGGFRASLPVVPDSFGFLIEARLAPRGGINQRLDFDDVWVIWECGEVALWRGSVPLAN